LSTLDVTQSKVFNRDFSGLWFDYRYFYQTYLTTALLRFLFYRKGSPRMKLTFSNSQCNDHKDCMCDLLVSGVEPISSFTVLRCVGGVPRKLSTMYGEMTARLTRDYSVCGQQVVRNLVPNVTAHLDNLIRASSRLDSSIIRPQFEFNNTYRITPRVDAKFLASVTQRMDKWYFGRLSMNIDRFIWRTDADNLVYQTDTVPSLVELAFKQLSFSHYCNGKRYGYSNWCATTESITPENVLANFEEFSVDNSTRDAGYDIAKRYFPAALNILFTKFYDSSQHFKKVKFDYNPIACAQEMNLMASSGIRPGISKSFVVGDAAIRISPIGKKLEQLPHAMKTHMNWVREVRAGGNPYLPSYCVIKIKAERKCAYGKPLSSLMKLPNKKREFNTTNTLNQLHSTWVNGPRIKLERGNAMNIGRKWWNGGALEFARYLHYDLKGMRWYEGDYVGHDKHIRDYLLILYQSTNVCYYDWENMTPEEQHIFLTANAQALFNMVVRPTCHTGNVWRIIEGVLYSGGKETSSAGSFITIFTFAIYLCHSMRLYPALSKQIMRALELGLILIAAYGDDHLWCAPASLESVLNEDTFAQVSFDFFGMIIQDKMAHKVFLSVPNETTGELSVVGPKFLKRYFIAGPDSPVLPFKPCSETVSKLLAPTSDVPFDTLIRSIGQAWDTMFTNPVAYQMCYFVYRDMLRLDTRTPSQIFAQMTKESENYRELSKKLAIDLNIMLLGFPDYNERRIEFHKWDASKTDYRVTNPMPIKYENYDF